MSDKKEIHISFDGATINNNGGTINGDIVNPVYKFYGAMDRGQLKLKVKAALETLHREEILKQENQWYAVKRCLTDKCFVGQNAKDFQAFVDSLEADLPVKCDNDKFRKVPNNCPRLATTNTEFWHTLENQTEAENNQIIVAKRLLELLQ